LAAVRIAPLVALGAFVAGEPCVPGTQPFVFHRGPIPYAAPVCFEITYPGLMRRFRAGDMPVLVFLVLVIAA
jgi:hypothetical protein